MKRLVSVLLLISIIFTLGASMVSCGHTHSWENKIIAEKATCEAAGTAEYTCSCGEKHTESIPKAHVWSESECGEKQYCEVEYKNNKEAYEAYLVEYQAWVDGGEEGDRPVSPITERTNPSTHSMDYMTKECKNCGRKAIIVDIPAAGTVITIKSGSKTYGLKVTATVECAATSITVKWEAEKIATESSDSALSATAIGYVLYDSDGYVITSGYDDAPNTSVGDKVRNQSFTINGLNEWSNYTLKFTGVNK